MSVDLLHEGARLDMRRQRRFGLLLTVGLVAVLLGWGSLAQISGAVVAPGRVAVSSSVKKVQHREGGIVSDLLVRDGDTVHAEQVLARLDATVPSANANVIESQRLQLTARRYRLEAERDGLADLAAPKGGAEDGAFQQMVSSERRLLVVRRSMRTQRKAQFSEQIAQTGNEIEGLQAQIASQGNQEKLIQGELVGVRQLYQKGLSPLSRVSQLEREAERLAGERGQLTASVARARTRIAEIRLQSLQVDSEALAEVMSDLKETEIKLAQLAEQKITADDAVRRVEVRAPASGRVQQLAIHTRGGVVAPGETMMLIVPSDEQMIVEARIDPQHVDQVQIGRPAHVRFTSFSSRLTPELTGRVDRVSADVETDEKTGVGFYKARLAVDSKALPKGLRGRLVAGMPAEVQIETSSHSALSYFLKPLTDQLARTFKED